MADLGVTLALSHPRHYDCVTLLTSFSGGLNYAQHYYNMDDLIPIGSANTTRLLGQHGTD